VTTAISATPIGVATDHVHTFFGRSKKESDGENGGEIEKERAKERVKDTE
jgi:hypothetical protein